MCAYLVQAELAELSVRQKRALEERLKKKKNGGTFFSMAQAPSYSPLQHYSHAKPGKTLLCPTRPVSWPSSLWWRWSPHLVEELWDWELWHESDETVDPRRGEAKTSATTGFEGTKHSSSGEGGWVGPRQQATSNRQHRLPFPTHSTRSRRRGLPLEGPGPGGGGGGGEVVPTTIDGVSTLSVSLHAQLPVARCSCRVGLPFESPPSPRASRTPRRCRPQALLHRCMVPAQQVCFHRSSTRCWHRLLAVDASLCRVLCVFCCSCTVPSG